MVYRKFGNSLGFFYFFIFFEYGRIILRNYIEKIEIEHTECNNIIVFQIYTVYDITYKGKYIDLQRSLIILCLALVAIVRTMDGADYRNLDGSGKSRNTSFYLLYFFRI